MIIGIVCTYQKSLRNKTEVQIDNQTKVFIKGKKKRQKAKAKKIFRKEKRTNN